MTEVVGKTRLGLDGEWDLSDFDKFTRGYLQVYAFGHAIVSAQHASAGGDAPGDGDSDERSASYAFRAYPWRGGWSSVDFYQRLRYAVPPRERPKIVQIRYASPGFIELIQSVDPAAWVALLIVQLPLLVRRANTTYTEIWKGIHDRKMNKIDLRKAELALTKEELAFAEEQFFRLGLASGLSDRALAKVLDLAGNPAMALKILMSFYRRLRDLGELQMEGKLDMSAQAQTQAAEPQSNSD